jgi:hypothetical protein
MSHCVAERARSTPRPGGTSDALDRGCRGSIPGERIHERLCAGNVFSVPDPAFLKTIERQRQEEQTQEAHRRAVEAHEQAVRAHLQPIPPPPSSWTGSADEAAPMPLTPPPSFTAP